MHENQGNSVIYYAHYTEGGVNKTGLTVTIDVYEVIRDGTATLVVNDGACTEIGAGLYRYLLASASVDAAAEYVAVFHTATDTVDAQDIPAIWVIDRAGTEKLDTGVPVASIATDAITAAALKADAVTEIQNGLALEATLTAIKGAGWTTETLAAIDVLIDAIKAKTDQLTFTTANKVDASATVDPTGIATSAALAVVDANVDAIKLKTDALDLSSVSVSSPISGTTITILRGDTLEVSISGLGSLASYVSLDFTVKADKTQADSDSLIRIRLNATGLADGLLTLNGATPSSADDGSIAITDAAAGDITITLAASCTDDLATGTYAYDVQLIEVGDVSTLTSGKATVIADVTRAVA